MTPGFRWQSAVTSWQDRMEGEVIEFDFVEYVKNPVLLVRLRAELTQSKLAEKMGFSQAYISKLEHSKKVSPKVLRKIMSCLNRDA